MNTGPHTYRIRSNSGVISDRTFYHGHRETMPCLLVCALTCVINDDVITCACVLTMMTSSQHPVVKPALPADLASLVLQKVSEQQARADAVESEAAAAAKAEAEKGAAANETAQWLLDEVVEAVAALSLPPASAAADTAAKDTDATATATATANVHEHKQEHDLLLLLPGLAATAAAASIPSDSSVFSVFSSPAKPIESVASPVASASTTGVAPTLLSSGSGTVVATGGPVSGDNVVPPVSADQEELSRRLDIQGEARASIMMVSKLSASVALANSETMRLRAEMALMQAEAEKERALLEKEQYLTVNAQASTAASVTLASAASEDRKMWEAAAVEAAGRTETIKRESATAQEAHKHQLAKTIANAVAVAKANIAAETEGAMTAAVEAAEAATAAANAEALLQSAAAALAAMDAASADDAPAAIAAIAAGSAPSLPTEDDDFVVGAAFQQSITATINASSRTSSSSTSASCTQSFRLFVSFFFVFRGHLHHNRERGCAVEPSACLTYMCALHAHMFYTRYCQHARRLYRAGECNHPRGRGSRSFPAQLNGDGAHCKRQRPPCCGC